MRRLVMIAVLAAGCTEHGQTPDGGFTPTDDGKANPTDGGRFACADDGVFEPNDSVQTAFQVPTTATITFAALALCPATDVDHYVTSVGGGATLEVVVAIEAADVPPGSEPAIAPGVAILNAAGTVLVTGSGGATEVRATAPNLPAGDYVARVAGAGVQENYRLTINVTP